MMAIAPELISPEPITDVHEFSRRVRETFNVGRLHVPDVGTVDVEVDNPDGLLTALREQLTGIGNEKFRAELAEALIESAVREDLRPVIGVLSAWFRTLSLKEHPEYEEAAEWARTQTDEESTAEAVDVEDLIDDLGLEDKT